MPSPSSRYSSIADLSRLSFAGLLGGCVAVGLAAQTYLLVVTTSLTLELERIIALVPVAVAVLSYVRNRPATTTPELGIVALWGFLAQWIALAAYFVVGPAFAGEVSVSAVLLSGAAELRLAELLRLLGTIVVFGGLHAVAASRRDRPIVAALALLAVPIATVAVYAVA